MNRIILILSLVLLSVNFVFAGPELTTVWEKSATQGTLPLWFDTKDFTRGFSYGVVNNQERLYVVSRNGGNFIYILNPATGDSVGKLDNTGITGGTYFVSDVGVSTDGIIFVCNLALNTTFKVYKWTDETAVPVEALTFDATGKRLGDKITVTGAAADNSLIIWVASVTSNELVKFTTTDNGATFTPEIITIGVMGGSASVGPLANGDFYYNAVGQNPKKFNATGTLLGTIPGSVVATGSNAIRFLTTLGKDDYFVTFQYGAGNENARVVRAVADAVDQAANYSLTPTLGTNKNANGAGDVSIKDNGDGTFTIFVLSTNNGLGAYKIKFPVPPIDPENVTLNWELNVNSYPFFANDNNTRGMGYNPATQHLLVASRTGAPVIYAIDAVTGAVADTLDMTGITGGTLPLMKVIADVNGVIYACNLVLANAEFKVYRWADEKATPTLAFAAVVSTRAGDAFSLSGSDTTTILYASGTGSNQILVLTTANGENFTAETPITIATGTARGGIAPIKNGTDSELWINGSGTTLRKIAADGTVLSEIDGGTLAASWMNCAYIEAVNGAKLVAVNANNVTGDIRKFQVWDVTNSETTPVLWAKGETGFLELANANGSGEIILNANSDETYSLFQMTTNNAIASWKLEIPEVIETLTIAEAKADTNNDFVPDRLNQMVTITGLINSPNYGSHTQYYMQDETAGIVLYSGKVDLALNAGDFIQVTGKLTQYRGISQIEPGSLEDVTVLGTGNKITPKTITISKLDESNEALLVKLENVWIVDMAQWPAAGKNGRVDITDGTDTTYIYIDKESELDGWTPPAGPMNLTAIVDQFTTKLPPDDGYSLRGTFKTDFEEIIPVIPPDELYTLWAKTKAAGTFPEYISTASYTRGMAYGNVSGQDRVYVVTRLGAHRIVIHDAMTGDSVGVIPKPAAAEGVGLFHLNSVDVSDDGIIFACNMTLGSDATHPFRVYRWDNETAAAVTVISLDTGVGRLGDMFSVYGSASDNSLTIYAGVSAKNQFVKFTTQDNGMTFTPEVITLAEGGFGTVPNIAEADDGTLWIKSYGRPLVHFNADGTVIDTLSGGVVGTGASKIKYFSTSKGEFLIAYYPDLGGAGDAEKLAVIDISEGSANARIAAVSPSIGNVANGNGVGSVDCKVVNEETVLFFILGTNNGIAAFTNNDQYVISNLDTLFYGDTPVLHENPYGTGFITGTNGYGDIGKYERFNFKAGDVLHGFKYYFAFKEVVGKPDTINLVLKTVKENGAPGLPLLTIKTTTSDLDITMLGNMFLLDNPVTLAGPVFVGFEFTKGSDDTVAIYADANGEGEAADRAWEQTTPAAFQSLNDPGDWSWHLDADLWIAAFYKAGLPTFVENEIEISLPTAYELTQNYPNPFNPTTTFQVKVPDATEVKITVYNALGQEVMKLHDGKLAAGIHQFEFKGSHLTSGLYLYRIEAKDFVAVRRMVLIK